MNEIARALRLFGRERGLWKYALRPLGWAALAFLALVLIDAALGERLGAALTRGSALGASIGAAAGVVLTLALVGVVYLPLVALISGFGFDRLSAEVEERAFGRVAGAPPSSGRGVADGVVRAVFAAALGIVGLCFAATVVVPWLLAALLILLDATAPALLRRGVGFGRQFGAARRLPGAVPFALVAGLVMLVPVVNVLALPVLVAAGTILVAGAEPR